MPAVWNYKTKNTAIWNYKTKNTAIWNYETKSAYNSCLLQEGSGYLLLEDGGRIILEQSIISYIPSWTYLNKN